MNSSNSVVGSDIDVTTISGLPVDIGLLKEQQLVLLGMVDGVNITDRSKEEVDAIDGILSMIDAITDIAEG